MVSVIYEGQGCAPVNANVRLHPEQVQVEGLITSFRDSGPRSSCPLSFQVTQMPPVSGNLLGQVISKPCSFPKPQDADGCSWFTQVYFPRPLLERGHGGGSGGCCWGQQPRTEAAAHAWQEGLLHLAPVFVTHLLLRPGPLTGCFLALWPSPGRACSSVRMRFGRFFLCAAAVPPLSSLPCVVFPRLPPPLPSSGRRAGPGVVLRSSVVPGAGRQTSAP